MRNDISNRIQKPVEREKPQNGTKTRAGGCDDSARLCEAGNGIRRDCRRKKGDPVAKEGAK